MNRLRTLFPDFIRSILNSYTQIFFSDNKVFAVILIIVTFFDWVAGLSGLLSVIISNVIAYLIGFNRHNIRSGFYGFNSLLVGLGLGVYYQLNSEFIFILVFASLLTLLLTVMFEGIIGKYGLPFLSLSFLIGIWMLTLATRQFSTLEVSERGVYMLNDLYAIGGLPLVKMYEWFNNLQLHDSIVLYFRSLGAIFFQYRLAAGVLVAIGLLIYSRIGFLLSVVGFASAWFFYHFIGADFSELNNSYIGFNFILTSIAIGGFFIVSSRYSFFWVILLTPLISITIAGANVVLGIYQLPVYSLPFNIIVLLFLYILKFRERFYHKPELVLIQRFSPEKNLYTQVNNKERFRHAYYIPFALPFKGEWKVTQAHDGEHTHKKDWKHAWDFEIFDENGMAYQNAGGICEDFYCYNKPVMAPYAGTVEEIIDNVDNNPVGDVNTEQNWGNFIILKHAEGLYSKLCHLKKDSVKVRKGDYVKKGDIIAACGNSGRSPKPHIHFQLQSTPFVGSKTLDYPLGHYIKNNGSNFELKSFNKPEQGDIISPIEKNNSLYKAFHFIPGQRMNYCVYNSSGVSVKTYEWEVIADIYNNTYIYCKATGSKLFFSGDDQIQYFTHFEGKKRSLLFYFFLAGYKVLFGFYKGIKINDIFPVSTMNHPVLMFLQDFVAPFFMFMKTGYTLEYISKSDDLESSSINLKSKVEIKIAGRVLRRLEFDISISGDRIQGFTISEKDRKIEARLDEEDNILERR